MIPIFDVAPELAGMQVLVAVALADYAAARDAEPQRAAVGPLRTVLACAREMARHAPSHHELWQQAMDVTQEVQQEASQAQAGHAPGSGPANAYLRVRLAAQGLRVQIVDRTHRLRDQEFRRRDRKVNSPTERQAFERWRRENGYPDPVVPPEWVGIIKFAPPPEDVPPARQDAATQGTPALAAQDDLDLAAAADDVTLEVSEENYQAAIMRKQPPSSAGRRALERLDQLQDAYRSVYGEGG